MVSSIGLPAISLACRPVSKAIGSNQSMSRAQIYQVQTVTHAQIPWRAEGSGRFRLWFLIILQGVVTIIGARMFQICER